jgi:hypothetical protein
MYCYSTDEEHFTGEFDTPEAAVNFCFEKHPVINVAYVGIKRTFTAHDFIEAGFLLEKITDNAYEECGEAVSNWLVDLGMTKRDELKALIGDWLEANAPINFFAVDDVLEYDRPDDGDEDYL